MPIDPLPQPPLRTMTPSVFAQTAQNYLSIGLPLFAKQATELEKNINAREANVKAANIAAQAAKEAAQAAQIAAENVAGAAAWDKVRTYATGECVYGTDGQTYRALKQSKNKNPVSDVLGYWSRISSSSVCFDAHPGVELGIGRYRISTPGRYNLPSHPAQNALVECLLDCRPTSDAKIVIARNGLTIEDRAEDLAVEDDMVKGWVMIYNGKTWRVIV